MASVSFKLFKGISPKLDPKELQGGYAQIASNIDLTSGKINPLKSPLASGSSTFSAVAKSLYGFPNGAGTLWFEDNDEHSVVQGAVPGTTENRTYLSGGAVPEMTYVSLNTGVAPFPNTTRRLGVPPPVSAPGIGTPSTKDEHTDPADSDKITTAYVCTYVTDQYEEGPPSVPSGLIDIYYVDQEVTVTVPSTPSITTPTGAPTPNITKVRIYRVATGTTGAAYQYVTETTPASVITDGTLTENLAASITSTNWLPPPPFNTVAVSSTTYQYDWAYPTGALKGLTMMANGIMAGYTGKEICFSEAYYPHAWPEEYRITIDYDIVGLAAVGQTLVVSTKGNPYLVTGVSPNSLTQTKLEVNQACVSSRSMVDMGESVLYAAPDGIVQVKSFGAKLVTGDIIDRDYWQSLTPSGIHAYYWEDKYVGFHSTGGFIYDPSSNDFTTFTHTATAGHNILEEDSLYISQGTSITKWAQGTAGTFTWKSAELMLDKPLAFSAVQVIGHHTVAEPVVLTLTLDGVEQTAVSITSNSPVRLPSYPRVYKYEIQVSGTTTVDSITLGNTIKDLGSL